MIILTPKSTNIKCSICLPYSKSETNRALIIQALSKEKINIHNISNCQDSYILVHNLDKIKTYQLEDNFSDYCNINVGQCGTAMRFLTSYLSIQKGKYILSGDTRMHNRPIGPLVESLLNLGANIQYIEKAGFPPLKITSANNLEQKGTLSVDASLSSQYISSLLLIAPYINGGLKITMPKSISSAPYIEMTLKIMHEAGIAYDRWDRHINIPMQKYKNTTLNINADWSSASYWYSIAALSNKATILIENIIPNSKQADESIKHIMDQVGVKTTYLNNSLEIRKVGAEKIVSNNKTINFVDSPDIAQSVITSFALLNYKLRFTGLHTLKIKEADRVEALNSELRKLNYIFTPTVYSKGKVYYSYKKIQHLDSLTKRDIIIDTHNDHRMAMSFAPLTLKLGSLKIANPSVVNKSYPKFWQDLEKIFIIN